MLKIIKEDIWKFWQKDNYIIIPTNGFVKKTGQLVMGKGLAWQAKLHIHNLDYILGNYVSKFGNVPHILENYIISFPVKHNWWEKADLKLIEKSAVNLKTAIEYPECGAKITLPIYCPKVGCGNGKLSWEQVEPILKKYLKDYIIIVDNN